MHLSMIPCSLLLATVGFVAGTALPVSSDLNMRQYDPTPINTAPLHLGACMAVGTCSIGSGIQTSCYTKGCGNETLLGWPCSCNADVQTAITQQVVKGKGLWPVKCPY